MAGTQTLGSAGATEFDLGLPWRLHPRVAIRPEPFGALLYHYETRRLTFVKDATLVSVLRGLADSDDVTATFDAAGVEPVDRPRFAAALARLASTRMLVRADQGESTS